MLLHLASITKGSGNSWRRNMVAVYCAIIEWTGAHVEVAPVLAILKEWVAYRRTSPHAAMNLLSSIDPSSNAEMGVMLVKDALFMADEDCHFDPTGRVAVDRFVAIAALAHRQMNTCDTGLMVTGAQREYALSEMAHAIRRVVPVAPHGVPDPSPARGRVRPCTYAVS